MKLRFAFLGLLSFVAVSCSYEESFFPEDDYDNSAVEFYAMIDEQPDADTKVYADDQLRVLWNADDRITIFNKYTYGYEYYFKGEDGDTAGAFGKVPNDDFVSGNTLDMVYAVYPYSDETKIDNDGIITLTLPTEQTYKDSSFGIGANTMVSRTKDNQLRFKNVGGYLSFKFYGDDVTVSSITIRGNNGERISGQCTIDMSSGIPMSEMDQEKAFSQITLKCETPIKVGSTADEASEFWFVVPPVVFTKGFTVTVTSSDGRVFKKTSSKKLEIKRSSISRMSAIEVKLEETQPNNVVYYTSVDGKVLDFTQSYFGTATISSNEYIDGHGVLTFDQEVTQLSLMLIDNRLASIAIPGSVSSINGASLTENSLVSIRVDPSNPVYDSRESCNAVIETESNTLVLGCSNTVIPQSVVTIGRRAFSVCRNLTTITIPSSVVAINESAFAGCWGLASITIPSSVITLGNSAFSACRSLASITIPSSVVSIGESLFGGCDSLCSLAVDFSNPVYDSRQDCNAIIETAANRLIAGCQTTVIPNSVTCIGAFAFSSCRNLTSISIPDSVTTIEESAFIGCSGLTSIIIPESVTTLERGFLRGCSSLSSINGERELIVNGTIVAIAPAGLTEYAIPDGVMGIGDYVFYDCPLTSITIPESVTSIGEYAFWMGSLTEITIPSSVSSIGEYAFGNCSQLSSIVIPDTIISISAGVFFGCSNLTSITIPSSVVSIGNLAFSCCMSLTSITIPESVTFIGSLVFMSCRALTSITVNAINPPSSNGGLMGTDCFIYVPSESVEAYKTAQYWSNFADRIKPIEIDY